MRIARFVNDGDVAFGVIETSEDAEDAEGTDVVAELAGHPFGDVQFTGTRHRLDAVRLLPPFLPSKVVAVGRNYAEHVRELAGDEVAVDAGVTPPAEPVVFLKPSTAIIGHGESISYPAGLSERVDFEGELAVVIGRLCRDVPRQRVTEVIFGYTCANDVTARDLQRRDGQWTRAKGFDTFCPLGPWIETEADPADLAITTTVNGEVRQAARTSALIHDIPTLVVHISHVMTLLPGDVILTGTPAGVGPVHAGDEVAVTVESVGTLANRVVSRD